MNINDSNSITQYSGPIRGSKSYLFETLFKQGATAFENFATINFTGLLRDISRFTDRPVLLTLSVSDYLIKHTSAFVEADRQALAINSPELTSGSSRYLTLLPNDQGVGLFGSNAIVLETLPPQATFYLGMVNPVDPSDTTIHPPNTSITFPPLSAFNSQELVYAIVRFRVQAQFL